MFYEIFREILYIQVFQIFEYLSIHVYFTSFALVACWLVRVFWNFL